jgi:glycosyltransferase involved in cell wall biosynthesis
VDDGAAAGFVPRGTKLVDVGALAPASPRRRRVLVSAYAVSPVRGSEPGMGWNICLRLARHHDVTVLCSSEVPPKAEDFRGEVEQYLRQHGPVPGLTFHFVEPPLASYLLQRESPLLRRTLYYAGYRAWQRAAFRAAKAMHAAEPFDLVHQLNITGFREPGDLWRLPAPFVWGPVGGAANVPAAFMPLMGARDRLFYTARNFANTIQQKMRRRCRRAARRASHVWAIGDANRRLVEDTWGRPAEPMLEVGGERHPEGRVRTYDGSRPLRLAWSGQHVGRKALPLLLRALHGIGDATPVHVTVLGDGPETAAWKQLAARLGTADKLRWTGQLCRADALREMSAADAFVSTSVLEETSLVVLEALSLGLPVVCHDAYGMGVAVDETCGIKVPMRTPDASVAAFADAVRSLASAPARVRVLSEGALARAEALSWDRKARQIADTYERVVAAATASDATSSAGAGGAGR